MTLFFIAALAFAQGVCPVGNIKACQSYLKTEHAKKNDSAFVEKFDVVCGENKTFSCIKMTVRDDVNLVLKDQIQLRGPNAALYVVKLTEENFIYILAPKSK